MEAFIVLLASLLSISLVVMTMAAKGSKTRKLDENRRAARRYDNLL